MRARQKDWMWRILLLAIFGIAAWGAGGCRSTDEVPKLEAIPQTDHAEADLFARETGEAMLAAYQKRDYKAFSKAFAPELAERLEEADFRQLRTDLGEWKRREFLTGLHNPSFSAYFWKLTFVQFSNGKYVTFETLFQLSIVRRSGEYQVVGCLFR